MVAPGNAELLEIQRALADGGQITLLLRGEVDVSTAPQIIAELEGVIAAGHLDVQLDFTGVTFMDSSGLGAVIQAHRTLAQHGGSLRLGERSDIVGRLFDVSGIERALGEEA